MLVSVTERTREIGLAWHLGPSGAISVNQFLVEAAVLCIIGGAIGLASPRYWRASSSAWPLSGADRCRNGARAILFSALRLASELPPSAPRACPRSSVRSDNLRLHLW